MKNSAVKIEPKSLDGQIGRILNFTFVTLLFVVLVVALFYIFDKAAVMVAQSVI